MPEIALHFPLEALDWAIYSLVLIPKTRAALHLAEHELGWMNRSPPGVRAATTRSICRNSF